MAQNLQTTRCNNRASKTNNPIEEEVRRVGKEMLQLAFMMKIRQRRKDQVQALTDIEHFLLIENTHVRLKFRTFGSCKGVEK